MQSSSPVRFQPGLYQKLSLDDFGIDQGDQRDGLVKSIKSEMIRLGCYHGKIDAVWGQDIRNELETLDRGLPTLTAEKVTLNYLKKQRTIGCDGNQGWDKLTTEGKGNVRVTGSIGNAEPVISRDQQTQPQAPSSQKRKVKINSQKHVSLSSARQKLQTVQKAKAKPAVSMKKVPMTKASAAITVRKPALKKDADKKMVQSVMKNKIKHKRRRKRHARKKFGTHSIFGLDSF